MKRTSVFIQLSQKIKSLHFFLLLLCFHESYSNQLHNLGGILQMDKQMNSHLPKISPTAAPQPFLPLLAPSPFVPYANISIPKLSGVCPLNLSASENLMSTTSIDCWAVFAPFLANLICCPQLRATLEILVGQSSKQTNILALDSANAKHCYSDIEQILMSQGASPNLPQICSVHFSNLTEASCPVRDVNEFEGIADTSKLLNACGHIDPVKECCDQICQNAISEAATKIAANGSDLFSTNEPNVLPEQSTRVNDCKHIVLRWLARRLDPSLAKKVLRGLSNCNVNRVCPLVFPDMRHVAKDCGNGLSNKTACCSAMESYVSHLQKQSFITNLQALDCANSLAMKLRKSNITIDVYSLCHISLKDFSLQVGNQGCLLPSLPSDATLDRITGVISFICDLNDNIPALWPSTTEIAASSCNKSVNIPALPDASSEQISIYNDKLIFSLLVPFSMTFILPL